MIKVNLMNTINKVIVSFVIVFFMTSNIRANDGVTEYSRQFINMCQGEEWFIEEISKIVRQQGKDINKLKSKEDFNSIYSIGLQNKGIEGKIPKGICELYNIQNIYLGDNNISGEIPEELFQLSELKNLDLSNNNISGELPKDIGNLKKLEILLLSNNNISGELPEEIESLNNLENLDISNNNIKGEIPKGLGNLENLKYLALAENDFTGEIPKELSNLLDLEVLLLWGNELTGNIPEELGVIDNLIMLDLSENNLSGEIPEFIINSDIEYAFEENEFTSDNDYEVTTRVGVKQVVEEVVEDNESIIELNKNIKYINGYTDGTFRPNNNITREEIGQIIYTLIKNKEEYNSDIEDFKDVEEKWSYEAIRYLQVHNILSGYNGYFRPNENLTRAEFATILAKIRNLEEESNNNFEDTKTHWAYKNISKVYNAKYMVGYVDGTFRPNNNITRVEVVVALNRALEKNNDTSNLINIFSDVHEGYWAYEDILRASN